MDGDRYEQFFLQPQDPWHRRYEALRAVFVEGQSMADVAQRLDVAHGTVRNWASAFRKEQNLGQAAPFFASLIADITMPNRIPKKRTNGRRSPMCSNYRWKRDVGFVHGLRASSCSGPCWPSYGSIGSSVVPIIPVPKWSRLCKP
jgi:transposase-like protein